MTEVLTYEALKEKCDRMEQINAQTLQVKLTMAETIKELTDRVNALAVESAGMREALDSIRIYSSDTLSGPSDSVPDMAAWLREGVNHLHQVSTIETPATSAALAAIEARAKVEAIELLIGRKKRELADMHPDTHAFGMTSALIRNQIRCLESFATELREGRYEFTQPEI